MSKHIVFFPLCSLALTLAAACNQVGDPEPDQPADVDGAPPIEPPPRADAGVIDAPPPDAQRPDQPPPNPPMVRPVITQPGEPLPSTPPPAGSVAEGVHLAFPPPVSMTPERRVTVRGTARLRAGVYAISVNGIHAWLSQPASDGAVYWQARLLPGEGINEFSVSGVDINGGITPGPNASVHYAPELLFEPTDIELDPATDRLFVSDRAARSILSIHLETREAEVVANEGSLGGSLTPGPLSLDTARDRLLALFDRDPRAVNPNGSVLIDTDEYTHEIQQDAVWPGECDDCGSGATLEHPVLDPAGARFFYVKKGSSSNGGYRQLIVPYEIGVGERELERLLLCDPGPCNVGDVILDRRSNPAGSGLLALIYQTGGSAEVRAIDFALTTQTPVVPVQTSFPGVTIARIQAMALDASGNRLFVLGVGNRETLRVIRIDLTSGEQSLIYTRAPADGFSVDADMVYDPRRDRLIIADPHAGVFAINLAARTTQLLFGPTIGLGPAVRCSSCVLSTVHRVRQRFFIEADDEIFMVDLPTSLRWRMSERGQDGIDLRGADLIVADEREDRLIVFRGAALYLVDLTTGARSFYMATLQDPVYPAAWDAERGRILYVTPTGALHEIDVENRTTRVVASSADGIGIGPPLSGLHRVAVDESGTRAFVGELYASARSLLGVDLASGRRTPHQVGDPEYRVSDGISQYPFVVDARRNRLLVAGYPTRTIGAIDLTSGVASIVADANLTGPGRLRTRSISPDLENDRILIMDDDHLVQMVDVITGERVIVLRVD
jgi:hypothetical protein